MKTIQTGDDTLHDAVSKDNIGGPLATTAIKMCCNENTFKMIMRRNKYKI